jgi:hypothetical protein
VAVRGGYAEESGPGDRGGGDAHRSQLIGRMSNLDANH